MKLYADGSNLQKIACLNECVDIEGFTTNPTLMRKDGVSDYRAFSRSLLEVVTVKPVSFEVLADDAETIYAQAKKIHGWGDNVYVKVPVTTTAGESLAGVVGKLAAEGVKVNVTAIFTLGQAWEMLNVLERQEVPACLSVFAGRIADAGVDPVPMVKEVVAACEEASQGLIEVIWASPREVLNIVQAAKVGCHIITLTPELLGKRHAIGTNLLDFSRDTVAMFHSDAEAAGYFL